MAKSLVLLLFFLPTSVFAQHEALDRVLRTGELRWCTDMAGGAPYIFPDEKDPNHLIGFEVDLMEAVAKDLGLRSKIVLGQWEDLVPMLLREDCDTVVNGLEITSERKKVIDFSLPYYFFSEQLTVRKGETHYSTLADLHGHRVATLSASLAEEILRRDPQLMAVPYPSPVEAYKDLELGRIDGALFDGPIANWYAGPNPHLSNAAKPIGLSSYGAGFQKGSPLLRERMNQSLSRLITRGTVEKIYRNWNLWTPDESKLALLAEGAGEERVYEKPWWKFIPLLFEGAGMTILISCLSMTLAVLVGFLLCFGNLYGGIAGKAICSAYIEIVRGTPLLIQLSLLYYGLPNIGIQLSAFTAAILGMGFNYAAYEAEIYRAGLLAIPPGQSDAARSLGMTRNQTLAYILIPQAFRTILPPSTNDFIALFKDTSLVSVITVTELTKVYGTAATTTYRFLELGLVTAALYFAMSYPLSLWSRSLERKQYALH